MGTPSALCLRRAQIYEIPQIVEMQVALAAETEPFRLDSKTVLQGVQAVFADSNKGSYWVAEQDGKLLGMLLTIPEWSDWRNGTVWWIHSVYVQAEARKQGVYAALYAHLKDQVLKDQGLRGLRLYVEKSNTRAQAVYERLGMSDEHYRLYEWMKDF